MGRKRHYAWIQQPSKSAFEAKVKSKILQQTQKTIDNSEKLEKRVSRIAMRGNRVYLYELVEQFIPEGAIIIKPLIDGKFLEYPYARITISDMEATNCTVDWQRHNNQWMSLYKGTLKECLMSIENDTAWFK